MSSMHGAAISAFFSNHLFFFVLTFQVIVKQKSVVRPPGPSSSLIAAYLESTRESSRRFDGIFYNNIQFYDATGPEISVALRNEMSYYAHQLTTIQISPAHVYEKAVRNLEEARLSNVISAIEKAKNEVIEVVRSERRTYLESVIIAYCNDFDQVDRADVQRRLKEFDNRLTDLKIPLSGYLWHNHTPGLNATCLSPYPTTDALLKIHDDQRSHVGERTKCLRNLDHTSPNIYYTERHCTSYNRNEGEYRENNDRLHYIFIGLLCPRLVEEDGCRSEEY
ncbi:hypothetical protein QR680_003690 [Steinernema hermaphroditum]|uniref:Uncharacterized protein n=1 Tax=Steinernema hermaphroditum TaxID=289476 RepID=A0AA39HL75_9BILA|nr:hypothetical protein QR680_003690 [Steinernema hermaphroditum]